MLNSVKKYLKITIRLFFKNPIYIFTEWYNFYKDYILIKKQLNFSKDRINIKFLPCLFDKKDYSLNIQYYDYQNGWAFEKILESKPEELIDIGSNIAFLVFASKLTRVTAIDIRKHNIPIKNLETKIGDILSLPYENNSIDFLSSLSVIEHIGLGRYGEVIDFDGMNKSINEFYRVLKSNAILLVSFPIGATNTIEFNAHRRFSPEKIHEMFNRFSVVEEIYILKNEIVDINKYKELGKPSAFACYKFIKN